MRKRFDAAGRQWMQDNILHVPHAPSTTLTAPVLRSRARRGNLRFVEEGKGNLISSMVSPGKHRPILDLDFPHEYVPSSTKGHGHLYLNHLLLDDLDHHAFVKSLCLLGILGQGSMAQVEALNMNTVRPPGQSKYKP